MWKKETLSCVVCPECNFAYAERHHISQLPSCPVCEGSAIDRKRRTYLSILWSMLMESDGGLNVKIDKRFNSAGNAWLDVVSDDDGHSFDLSAGVDKKAVN